MTIGTEFTDDELRVIDEMSDDMAYPFARIADWSGVPEKRVREIVRDFKECGIARYGPTYDEDEYRVCGSGYWLTREGCIAQREARARTASSTREA